ncbi:GNAT family N-acetyltransferase [Methylobacterium iners]|uniref:N-acetyltransferase domain-containing protein n=1 Tax=Methylobacterium iners TaxID=418707 RepID=A0ABQ4RW56_9HYPH|nr:GNAT family N-acetyltransferase [Methylobacterium iners]GJD94474.1 hypothetical protein OCOJLMKI_1676 [Methylobacterium iners]
MGAIPAYRHADPGDAEAIANLMLHASGDILRFLLDELAPELCQRALMTCMVSRQDGPRSYRRCIVAQVDGVVVGVANAFPAAAIRQDASAMAPTARERWLGPLSELQDWSSLLLNSLAVNPLFRCLGIGSGLIGCVVAQARSEGFPDLTLHVWADNAPARRLYRRRGFEEIAWADIAAHPALPHEGGSFLMRRPSHDVDGRAACGPSHGRWTPIAIAPAVTPCDTTKPKTCAADLDYSVSRRETLPVIAAQRSDVAGSAASF